MTNRSDHEKNRQNGERQSGLEDIGNATDPLSRLVVFDRLEVGPVKV